jgi:hypothetical protein
MSDCNEELNQIDEETILRDEVPDEALEAASVVREGFQLLRIILNASLDRR